MGFHVFPGNNLLHGKDASDGFHGNVESMLESFTDSLETSLMAHDALTAPTSPPAVSRPLGAAGRPLTSMQHQPGLRTGELQPKVLNNPDSQDEVQLHLNPTQHRPNHTDSPRANKKAKDFGILSQLALIGKLAFGGRGGDGKKGSSEMDRFPARVENGRLYETTGRHNPMFEPSQGCETEVRLTGSRPVVHAAPAQVKVSNLTVEGQLACQEREAALQVREGDAGMDADPQSLLISRHRVAPYSKSTSDLSPEKTCCYTRLEDELRSSSRPSSLSLKGHNYLPHAGSSSLTSLSKLKGVVSQKGIKLVPTKRPTTNGYTMMDNDRGNVKPVSSDNLSKEKNARFSLHDDRLMSDSSKNLGGESTEFKKNSNVNQFKSINANIANMADCTC